MISSEFSKEKQAIINFPDLFRNTKEMHIIHTHRPEIGNCTKIQLVENLPLNYNTQTFVCVPDGGPCAGAPGS